MAPGLPPDTPRVPAGLSGRLLFTWKDGLETLDLGTARLDQVVPAPPGGRVTSARWSPSAEAIAYALAPQEARSATRSAVVVASADGTQARTVVSGEASGVFYHWPTWDPDGEHLYALRAEASGSCIERIHLASGERRTVVDRAADFDVSRDGRLLAFVRPADAGATLNVIPVDGSAGERVLMTARPFQVIAAPRFAPDGRSVLFSLSRPPEAEASTRALPRLVFPISAPSALAHGLPQDIYSVPIAEGSPGQLARLGADDPVATWSPDASRLAVLTITSLGIMSPGGSVVPILAPGGYGSVDWAP